MVLHIHIFLHFSSIISPFVQNTLFIIISLSLSVSLFELFCSFMLLAHRHCMKIEASTFSLRSVENCIHNLSVFVFLVVHFELFLRWESVYKGR